MTGAATPVARSVNVRKKLYNTNKSSKMDYSFRSERHIRRKIAWGSNDLLANSAKHLLSAARKCLKFYRYPYPLMGVSGFEVKSQNVMGVPQSAAPRAS